VQIVRDIPLALEVDKIATALGRGKRLPGFEAEIEWAIAAFEEVWAPAALIDLLPVRSLAGQAVTLQRPDGAEAVLHLGPKADLLAPAELVQVSVNTVGPGLDRLVREIQAGGDSLKAYLLDSVGVLALAQAGAAVTRLAEAEAADRGWGVGRRLSPGSLIGWPLTGQRELCALLPLEGIGVQLNQSCVLIPFKSGSAVIGLGPGYQSRRVGSVCRWCVHASTCWRRKDDEAWAAS